MGAWVFRSVYNFNLHVWTIICFAQPYCVADIEQSGSLFRLKIRWSIDYIEIGGLLILAVLDQASLTGPGARSVYARISTATL